MNTQKTPGQHLNFKTSIIRITKTPFVDLVEI